MQVLADESRVATLMNDLVAWVDRLTTADTGDVPGAGAGWALIGLKSRGDVLAGRIADRLGTDRFAGRVGSLDITLYRDDLSEIGPQPVVRTTEIDFDITDLSVVLIDDVLMTGRTIRAALQSLMDLGRPKRVWLGVLVDRGGRELPIAPDFAAWDLTGRPGDDKVKLTIRPIHDRDELLAVPDPRNDPRSADPSKGQPVG